MIIHQKYKAFFGKDKIDCLIKKQFFNHLAMFNCCSFYNFFDCNTSSYSLLHSFWFFKPNFFLYLFQFYTSTAEQILHNSRIVTARKQKKKTVLKKLLAEYYNFSLRLSKVPNAVAFWETSYVFIKYIRKTLSFYICYS